MKILFVLGSLAISGGHYVVLQHAEHARAAGHKVTLVVLNRGDYSRPAWHPSLATLKICQVDDLSGVEDEQFDIAIATYWRTALELHRFNARQYAYFVQSIESRFYDESQVRMRRLVDRTYELGLPGITEATWIQRHLRQEYGSEYLLAHNGVRKASYTELGAAHAPRISGKLRVLVEGPFSLPIKNTARTVRVTARSRANETWLLTSSDVSWYPRVKRAFSRVPIEKVAEVYRSCDVIAKLSLVEGMFGPPLEMFHCGGTAVVYDVSGHDEYIVHGRNALVAAMHDEAAVVAHLNRLCGDPQLLAQLKEGARATAADWPDWPQASAVFLAHLDALLAGEPVQREQLVARTMAIFDEFEAELRPRAARGTSDDGAALALSGVRRTRHALRRYKRMWDYIVEGYR
ncbi:MAG TPA: glycosyltransferase family 4 protein [Burkholderiaceae bacterium]